MLRETLSMVRDLSRLHEISAILIRYGWGDVVRILGVSHLLERAGRLLHWQTSNEITQLDLPVRIRLALTDLGPTFVKLGQILATRVDVFPPSWIAEFEKLHSQVPPVPFERLRPGLEALWGRPVESMLQDFQVEPFAAASIAQVHRAKLADGTPVVVKVRRPDILPKIEADLRILNHLARIMELQMPDIRRYRPVQIVGQLKRSLLRELDLVKEARNLDTFAEHFRGDESIHIPRVYWEYCGESVNVQEELVGIQGTDIARAREAGYDLKLLAARGADAVLKMILLDGYFHADPHPGNVIYLPGNRIGMLDFGMVGRITDSRRDQIIDFLEALIHKDEGGMLNVLSLWAGDAEIDEEHLAYDISEMVFGYDNLTLKDIRIGPLLSEVTGVMRDNHLSLPPDLTLLFKAIITLEGLGHQLDPDFHMVDQLTPFVAKVLEARYSPRALAGRARRGLKEMADIVIGLPRDVARLFRMARRGRLRVDLDLKRLDHFGVQLNQAANRLTMGVLTASLVVGSSIIMTVEGGPKLFGLPMFGFLGFLMAFFNSVWIIYAIWRSGRD
ncbi:MAG TPA: AarF/UbiB family protein [Thiobacillaceae bacterium]|nr:AarF/UbiB family protein [Thiobacillaceae bacterium]HNA82319.1 AarF/UbiB family protein [Thiobacillaceae bacterium]HNF89339.1 AarF/UbiB family protein [Thiobacillaceae bacterium]HNI08240.1 AarF/UbiB family protein [Thiobacillaceae bacterium]